MHVFVLFRVLYLKGSPLCHGFFQFLFHFVAFLVGLSVRFGKKKKKSIFTLPRVVTLMECYLWGNIHCGLDYLKLSGWNDMEKTLYLALCEERGGGEREVIYTVKTDVSRGGNICWV